MLRTIPGVGARTAEAILAYVDDARRFARSSQAAAYFGLVPCQDASAGTNRLGHITKQGPATARKYLVQAAWQAVRRSATIGRRYERLVGGRPERRKIALVAVAQWLVRCMVSMLRSGEVWRESARADIRALPCPGPQRWAKGRGRAKRFRDNRKAGRWQDDSGQDEPDLVRGD